jgi:hypothetical protein
MDSQTSRGFNSLIATWNDANRDRIQIIRLACLDLSSRITFSSVSIARRLPFYLPALQLLRPGVSRPMMGDARAAATGPLHPPAGVCGRMPSESITKDGTQMTQTPTPKWQIITGWVLSGLLAIVFLPSAFFKIAQPTGFTEEWSKTYPAASALPVGVIELAIYVLYLVPKTRYLGGLLMLAYLGGAVATHLHANDGMFFVPVLVGVVAWLGLYLRDRKLRALVPLVDE